MKIELEHQCERFVEMLANAVTSTHSCIQQLNGYNYTLPLTTQNGREKLVTNHLLLATRGVVSDFHIRWRHLAALLLTVQAQTGHGRTRLFSIFVGVVGNPHHLPLLTAGQEAAGLYPRVIVRPVGVQLVLLGRRAVDPLRSRDVDFGREGWYGFCYSGQSHEEDQQAAATRRHGGGDAAEAVV